MRFQKIVPTFWNGPFGFCVKIAHPFDDKISIVRVLMKIDRGFRMIIDGRKNGTNSQIIFIAGSTTCCKGNLFTDGNILAFQTKFVDSRFGPPEDVDVSRIHYRPCWCFRQRFIRQSHDIPHKRVHIGSPVYRWLNNVGVFIFKGSIPVSMAFVFYYKSLTLWHGPGLGIAAIKNVSKTHKPYS